MAAADGKSLTEFDAARYVLNAKSHYSLSHDKYHANMPPRQAVSARTCVGNELRYASARFTQWLKQEDSHSLQDLLLKVTASALVII